ncbi:MAG: BamA/TamA family outer membrane protein [Elusimicrobia bacterium]|nr:BamA/TamA family outer membrane protein [Elusimicrobiota bacterium]
MIFVKNIKITLLAILVIFCILAVASANDLPEASGMPSSVPPENSRTSRNNSNIRTIYFPIMFYTPETSLGLGLAAITLFRGSRPAGADFPRLNIFGMYSFNNEYVFGISPEYVTRNQKYAFRLDASIRNGTSQFFGLGNNTSEDDSENFSLKTSSLGFTAYRRILRNLRMGVRAEYSSFSIYGLESGGMLSTAAAANGRHIAGTENSHRAGAGIIICFNNNRASLSPTQGTRLRLKYMYHSRNILSDYEYSYIKADFRRYITLSENYFFAYQILGEFINGTAPFMYLPKLGGQSLLRGITRGRYSDNILIAFQPELQRRISRNVKGVLFCGIGNVYRNVESIDLSRLHFSGGVGARLRIAQNPAINLRLDVGFSKDARGVYFGIMEAF